MMIKPNHYLRAYDLVVLGVNYEIQKIEDHPMLSLFEYVINGNNYNVNKYPCRTLGQD